MSKVVHVQVEYAVKLAVSVDLLVDVVIKRLAKHNHDRVSDCV